MITWDLVRESSLYINKFIEVYVPLKIFSTLIRCLNNELLPTETKDMNPLQRQQELHEEQKHSDDSGSNSPYSENRMSNIGSDDNSQSNSLEMQINLDDLQDD